MRPLELAAAVLVIGAGLLFLSPRHRKLALGIWLLACCALVLHGAFEGLRLQATPIYLAVLMVGCCAAPNMPVLFRASASLAACTAACLGAVACYVYPVFTLPPPGGPYAIGTHTFYLSDPRREEHYSTIGGRNRRVVAQIWYPAFRCAGIQSEYRDPRTLIWKSAHLRYVKTHACADSPFSEAAPLWPIVFFSPSSGGFRSQNTFLTEFLVSRGYVVVGLDHPDTCARVAFPDGVVMHSLPDVWLNLDSKAGLASSIPKTEDILHTNVQDIQFVYSLLRDGSPDPRLQSIGRRVDFSRCAAVGHSFGGAAAAELCRIDPRFQAGVNLDGWMFNGVRQEGVPKPFLFMIEDDPLWSKNDPPFEDDMSGVARLGTADYKQTIVHSVTTWGGCVAKLIHGSHGDFADLASFVRPWLWKAPEQPTLAQKHEAVKRIVLAFLDEHLQGRQGALAQTAKETSRFAELKIYPQPSSLVAAQVREAHTDE